MTTQVSTIELPSTGIVYGFPTAERARTIGARSLPDCELTLRQSRWSSPHPNGEDRQVKMIRVG
ncbi:MAG TPA: hypothetical protein VFL04_05415 [Rectinemataceae bacterium]|nr:hypothetical protein [Rectinemataceae bacterium]